MKEVKIRLTQEDYERLRAMAAREKRSIKAQVEVYVERGLDRASDQEKAS